VIDTMVFDLDGTLVQTEKLKARSYAQAAVELCPGCTSYDAVIEGYKDVVGRSRREVASTLMKRFGLEEASRERMDELGVTQPWQAYVHVRLDRFESLIDDPEVLRQNRWPRTIELLETSRRRCRRVALATTSGRRRTRTILDAIGLEDEFDLIATGDDVEHQKPDPEIYELVAAELWVAPDTCLVLEDSPAGVRAALAAGMHVVAVATPFTLKHLQALDELDPGCLVEDHDALLALVARRIDELGSTTSTERTEERST
jgi:HAD superfamily hydrolase (TIGR01509 family)